MSLPYENSTSGERAVDDMRKTLQAFGCNNFGVMQDFESGELIVQFGYRGKQISLCASSKGYAAAWLKEHPYTSRCRGTQQQHNEKALKIGSVAIYSMVRDWIKGQITAVETGMMSFEGAFLSHIMLPDGRRVIEVAESKGLLPAPPSQK